MTRDVAITGTGAVTPLGRSVEETWHALAACDAVPAFPEDSSRSGESALGRRVDVPSATELGVTAREAWLMGKHGLLLVHVGSEALRGSLLDRAMPPAAEIAFYAALGTVDPAPEDLSRAVLGSLRDGRFDVELFFRDGYRAIHPLWPLSVLNNVGFSLACQRLGISGENRVFSPGPDAGLHAVVEAAWAVAAGRAKVALAAGVSETWSASSLARAWLCGDCSEGGRLPSEGCAAVALERVTDAEARGATILATVVAWGFACGEDGPTTIRRAIEEAVRDAELAPEEIDATFIAATDAGERDDSEMIALADLFRGSTRTQQLLAMPESIGNMRAAAGVAGLVLATQALRLQHLPAALVANGQAIVPQQPSTGARGPGRSLRRIAVVSRGHGGQVAAAVIEGTR